MLALGEGGAKPDSVGRTLRGRSDRRRGETGTSTCGVNVTLMLEGPIRTARLELVRLTAPFVAAVVLGDACAAAMEVGARVGRWLTADPSHLIQLHLAGQAADASGFPGLGRVIVLAVPGGARRVIGAIGFDGPPDDRGRLEASYRVHPAHRSRGFAAEALAALLDWATEWYGVTRFVVAVPAARERREPVPIEIDDARAQPILAHVDHLATLLEPERRCR